MRAVNIVVSTIALTAWSGLALFSLLFGGSPGPGYERTVPLANIGIMMLGIAGAVFSLIGAFLWAKAAKPLPVAAAALGILGSFPLFSLGLVGVGLVFLMLGILPPILCFTFARRKEK